MYPFKYNTDAEKRFWSKVNKTEDVETCWTWKGTPSKDGYGQFKYHCKHKRPNRFLWESLHGTIPEGMIIMHSCDNPSCVNPEHLNLGTHQDNAIDREKKKRRKIIPFAKLNQLQVDNIRQLYETGQHYQYELAKMFNVGTLTINRIIRRKTWA